VPDLAVHRWFIFTTWAMLAIVGGLLVLLYNLYPDRSLDAWVDRSAVCKGVQVTQTASYIVAVTLVPR
jgi:hypothetical protein